MAEARRVASVTAAPTWIYAARQTSARGRRGRPWLEPDGNFAATLLLPPGLPPAKMALRSFVASLALAQALEEVTSVGQSIALKWPNDVLLTGRKLAGVLLENLPSGHLSVGIGVNMRAAPAQDSLEEAAWPPIALNDLAEHPVPIEVLREALARHFADLEAQLLARGFDPIRRAWMVRAARLGERITAKTAKETCEGRFREVDGQGQLVLETPEGLLRIAAAEVYF